MTRGLIKRHNEAENLQLTSTGHGGCCHTGFNRHVILAPKSLFSPHTFYGSG